jgi:hypothetical protein
MKAPLIVVLLQLLRENDGLIIQDFRPSQSQRLTYDFTGVLAATTTKICSLAPEVTTVLNITVLRIAVLNIGAGVGRNTQEDISGFDSTTRDG